MKKYEFRQVNSSDVIPMAELLLQRQKIESINFPYLMSEKQVTLIENFVSWQGEGPDAGRTMIILRFKTCNLNCPWCDTAVKMRISAEAPYKLSDIQNTINEKAAGLLITGGEPTVPKHLDEALMLLNELDYPIANVETNGYNLFDLAEHCDSEKPIRIIYSPKIFNANDGAHVRDILDDVCKYDNIFMKFVLEPGNVYQENLLHYIKENYYNELVWNQRIWLMPEGTNRNALLRNSGPVFDACEKFNFNFSSRSHLIFDFV